VLKRLSKRSQLQGPQSQGISKHKHWWHKHCKPKSRLTLKRGRKYKLCQRETYQRGWNDVPHCSERHGWSWLTLTQEESMSNGILSTRTKLKMDRGKEEGQRNRPFLWGLLAYSVARGQPCRPHRARIYGIQEQPKSYCSKQHGVT
jgi:hypothetical protein